MDNYPRIFQKNLKLFCLNLKVFKLDKFNHLKSLFDALNSKISVIDKI